MQLVTVGDVQPREEHYLHLERGDILFFPRTPFALSEDHREVLRGASLTGGTLHKNIAYRPASGKVTGFDKSMAHDSDKLREILKGDASAFAECMAEKMLIYALGRGLERGDRKTVQTIAEKVAGDDYRFSSLVLGIVQSGPFQMRKRSYLPTAQR